MRVLHLTDVLPPSIGGIETALATLFSELRDLDHTVLTAQPPGSDGQHLGYHLRIRYLPMDSVVESLARLLLPGALRANRQMIAFPLHEWFRREAVRLSPTDVVHMHSYSIFRRYAGITARHPSWPMKPLVTWLSNLGTYGPRLLFTDHSLFGGPRSLFESVGNGLLLESLRFVVCVEASGKRNVDEFSRRSGRAIRTWMIPNPIDLKRFRPASHSHPEPLIVGYAGRFEKEGLDEVLRLIGAAPKWVQFQLALAVDASRRLEAEAEVGESPNLKVRWNVPYSEMPGFYNSVHVTLNPFAFGIPRTVYESLACGRPVVSLLREGVPNDVPTPAAPAIAAGDVQLLYKLLASFRQESQLDVQAKEARRFAEETFAASEIAARYRTVYEEIARFNSRS